MPSLTQTVASRLDGSRAHPTLGRLIGADEHIAAAASGAAMAVVVDGLAGLAGGRGSGDDDGGAEEVQALLEAHGSAPLDDLDGFLIEATAAPGNDILDRLFGAERGSVVVDLASRLGLSSSVVGRLLPLVAPLVTAELALRRDRDDLDGDALVEVLDRERRLVDEEGLLDGEITVEDDRQVVIDLTADGRWSGVAGRARRAARIGATGTGSTGAVATLDGTRTDAGDGNKSTTPASPAPGSVAGAEAGATSSTSRARSAGSSEAGGGSSEAGGSIAEIVLGEVGDHRSGPINWLWWAGGAAILVLFLAWLLSTCNDETTGAGDATTVVEVGDDSGATTTPADATPTTTQTDEASDDAGSQPEDQASGEPDDGETAPDGTDGSDGSDGQGAAAGETLNDLLDLAPVTFDVSSTQITPEGEAVLDQAAQFLADHPDVRVEIGGHTDDDGSEAANLDLSQRRAEVVLAHLIDAGIDASRLTARGYGESEPKVANTNLANKALNRRIEFTVM